MIDQKEVALYQVDSIEKTEVLIEELKALEWLRMFPRCSDKERENWALVKL